MILSENEQKIEKFCQDIRYQVGLLDSHMVVFKDGKKPLITQKQYEDSIRAMMNKIEEIEAEMPEDYKQKNSLNDKLNKVQEKIEEIKLMLSEMKNDITCITDDFDGKVHEAINEIWKS